MGGGVVLQVDRLDPLLEDGDAGLGGGEQHVDLVLVALAGDVREALHDLPVEGPQAGLGVVDADAAGHAEHLAGDAVAEAAAQGHVALEPAAAQHQRAGMGGGPLADLQDILIAVLPVGVGGDGQAALGHGVQHVAEGGLQRRALAPVLGVLEQRDSLGQGVEYRRELRPAAVVHHDGQEVGVVLELRKQ